MKHGRAETGRLDTPGATIRPERPADVGAIRQVNERSFTAPGSASVSGEGALVDALRGAVTPFVSLVAELEDAVVGHILFTPVRVERASGPAWSAIALGPMAVVPGLQGRGIGSSLVRAGLAECVRLGETVAFVLGHSHYYPRFGFRPARPLGLTCEWDVPEDVFVVSELAPGALAGRTGRVLYHPAFGAAT